MGEFVAHGDRNYPDRVIPKPAAVTADPVSRWSPRLSDAAEGNADLMTITEHVAPIADPSTPTESACLPAAVGRLDRLAIATDESDEALARVRRIALDLARTNGFEVILYDRSHERWTDHPHPTGPVTADEIVDTDREHLVVQLREFEDAGVTATAWLATIPAITAMLDMLQALDVDAIMLPEQLDEPKLMDRLQIGKTAPLMVQRIAELSLQHPPTVLSVPEVGPITVANFDGVEQ